MSHNARGTKKHRRSVPVYRYGSGARGEASTARRGDKMVVISKTTKKVRAVRKRPKMGDGQGLHGGVKFHEDGRDVIVYH